MVDGVADAADFADGGCCDGRGEGGGVGESDREEGEEGSEENEGRQHFLSWFLGEDGERRKEWV